jgi:tetratricopeptide (TPR) repeat protein/predicted Ser/Thr protein kinase
MLEEDRRFAELAVSQGLCTREQADECLSFIEKLAAQGVTPLPRIGELMARKGYLSPSAAATLKPASSTGTGIHARDAALPPEAEAAARDPANRIGRYVKTSPLGAGGMGEVWKAWDGDLARWVALKFVHHPDPDQVARFRREAQTAAALSHPNIAAIYEVGEAAGRPFLAMQFVAGQALSSVPRDDRRRLVGLIRDAALAVHFAHEQGVVHRDLKPHNLMAEGSRVFVLDFGLAKPTRLESSISISGAVVGTPAYMPPEQAQGRDVDARSDVYSLGATLYELLSGRPPFDAKEVYAVLRKVVEEDPAALPPSVDRDLRTIVLKCLEKDPERRYDSARGLADDLGRWLNREAILAHPPSAAYRARKWLLRHRALSALAAVVLAAGVALVVQAAGRRSETAALRELGALRTETLVAREWMRQPFRTPAEIRGALERSAARIGEHLARHPASPQARHVRAQALLALGDLRGAERELDEALRAEPAFAPGWSLLARVRFERAVQRLYGDVKSGSQGFEGRATPLLKGALQALGRGGGSERAALQAWGLARTEEDARHETLLEAFRVCYLEKDGDRARGLLEEAQRRAPSEEYCRWIALWSPAAAQGGWLDRALGIAPHYAAALADRANRRYQDRDWDGAAKDARLATELNPHLAAAWALRAALRLRTKEFELCLADAGRSIAEDPELALGWVNRAAARIQRREWDAALRDCEEALRLDPRSPTAWSNRATVRLRMGDPRGAQADADEAIRLDPDLALAWVVRSAARLTLADLDGALGDAGRAIELDPDSSLGYGNRGAARLRKGDVPGAAADFDEALRLDPGAAEARSNRAAIRIHRQEWDAALADLDEVIRADPGLAIAWANRGMVRQQKGDLKSALEDVDKAFALGVTEPEPRALRAELRNALGDLDGAIRDLEDCLRIAPAAWHGRAEVERMLEAYRRRKP